MLNGGYFRMANYTVREVLKRIGPHAFSVFAMLSSRADKDGKCWPSLRTLEQDTGISRKTIIQSLRTLEAEGLVTKFMGDGTHSNTYTVRDMCGVVDTPLAPGVVEQVHHSGVIPPPLGGVAPPPKGQPKKQDPLKQTQLSCDARFDAFWNAYPKKVGKIAVRRAWDKLRVGEELHKKIMRSLGSCKRSEQWRRDAGQYIPNPLTWLGQGRYEDEVDAPPVTVHPAGRAVVRPEREEELVPMPQDVRDIYRRIGGHTP